MRYWSSGEAGRSGELYYADKGAGKGGIDTHSSTIGNGTVKQLFG